MPGRNHQKSKSHRVGYYLLASLLCTRHTCVQFTVSPRTSCLGGLLVLFSVACSCSQPAVTLQLCELAAADTFVKLSLVGETLLTLQ
jgi:hypothetical protein